MSSIHAELDQPTVNPSQAESQLEVASFNAMFESAEPIKVVEWAAAQFPNLITPDLTLQNAAAPTITLQILLTLLGLGALLLFPSFYFLYRLFKGEHVFKVLKSGSSEIDDKAQP